MNELAAVWTGSRMVIWGGHDDAGVIGTGGRYDPATDTWSGISEVGAPSPRTGHITLWTGDEVMIWGGSDGTNAVFDDGAYYDSDEQQEKLERGAQIYEQRILAAIPQPQPEEVAMALDALRDEIAVLTAETGSGES